jgi:hypothetical protein
MTGFELNEDLKDRCMLLGATKAVTTHFKEGFPLLPEPFWETIVVLHDKMHKNHIKVIFSLIKEYMKEFEEYGFNCADPVFEFSYGEPRIVYAIFPGYYSFTKKLIKDE